jgi:hypothetical protein
MWKEQKLTQCLKKYSESHHVNKIIVIDNDKISRPVTDIFSNSKIEMVCYDRNIYVNPAWNEGYYRSNTDVICFLNDDIEVNTTIFEFISTLDFSEIDIIGVHLRGSEDNFHIVDHTDKKEDLIKMNVDKTKPIGGQAYAFGVCMFIKRTSYRVIPSLYQIWHGDDYLVQRNKNIYVLKTSKIEGEISKTITKFDKNSDVQRRIDLDSLNAYRYNHFLNGKNWDLLKNAYVKNLSNIEKNK